jgi:hypothetical protein
VTYGRASKLQANSFIFALRRQKLLPFQSNLPEPEPKIVFARGFKPRVTEFLLLLPPVIHNESERSQNQNQCCKAVSASRYFNHTPSIALKQYDSHYNRSAPMTKQFTVSLLFGLKQYRYMKELKSYDVELVNQQERISKLIKSGADDADVRKQKEVLEESVQMIPEVKRRLATAYQELRTLIVSK